MSQYLKIKIILKDSRFQNVTCKFEFMTVPSMKQEGKEWNRIFVCVINEIKKKRKSIKENSPSMY